MTVDEIIEYSKSGWCDENDHNLIDPLIEEVARLRKLINCPICDGKGYWGDPMGSMGNFGACTICHGAESNG